MNHFILQQARAQIQPGIPIVTADKSSEVESVHQRVVQACLKI